jgi:hypothetical protein
MFQAIRQGASAVVASIASPFRRGLPVRSIDASPSASIGVSELTNFYSAEIETEESIHLRAAKDYAERGNGGDSDEEGEEFLLHHNLFLLHHNWHHSGEEEESGDGGEFDGLDDDGGEKRSSQSPQSPWPRGLVSRQENLSHSAAWYGRQSLQWRCYYGLCWRTLIWVNNDVPP